MFKTVLNTGGVTPTISPKGGGSQKTYVQQGDMTSARPIGTPPIKSEAAACTGQTGLIRGRAKLLSQDKSIVSRERK